MTNNRGYKGCNAFYEGWLASYWLMPRKADEHEAWLAGWDCANETSPVGRHIAFSEELELGHIVKE